MPYSKDIPMWQPLRHATVDNSGLPGFLHEHEVWKNDLYTVFVRRNQHTSLENTETGENITMAWLSIKRNDKEARPDWRHFQYIKNQLVGEENEGCELFPAESRLVDGANQYHLWVFEKPNFNFPFGFDEGRKLSRTTFQNSKQRPFPPNMIPPDIEESERKIDEEARKFLTP